MAIGVACAIAACGPRTARSDLEAAYRANNRGVALLEQFDYGQAVEAFRDALTRDPSMRLARINLPIALFYDGKNMDAAEQARAASRAYPDAPQPLFILGLAARADNRMDEAADAFRRVLRLDPDDVGAKVQLALIAMQERQYTEAIELSRSALALEPFNATAAYNLSLALTRTGDSTGGTRAMERFEKIRAAGAAVTYSQTYLEQGRYAEAVASTGAEAELVTTASPGVRFVDMPVTLDGSRRDSTTRNDVAEPLAGNVTLADIDQDGDLDVIVTGPFGVRLLRNERSRFVDATSTLGDAAIADPATGSIVGDFNNDTRPDLLLLTTRGPRLFMQSEGGGFKNVDLKGADRAAPRVARSAAFVDVDHDGDLDVLIGGFVDPPPPAAATGWGFLGTNRPTASLLLRNNGNGTFTDITSTAGLEGVSAVVALGPTDFDNHRDVDLLTVSYGSRPRLFKNLRTGAFEDVAAEVGLPERGPYTSVAMGDVNKDGFTDLFFGRESSAGVWALSDGHGRFRLEAGPESSTGTIAAQLFDYDNDGLLDLLIATSEGPHLYRNIGQGWREETSVAFPPDIYAALKGGGGIVAMTAGDIDLDGKTDVVVLLRSGEVRMWRSEGQTGNHSLRVTLKGRVSNRDGLGAKVEMRAGSLHQKLETASTSPAIVPADLVFGLGRRTAADVVRAIWPAGIVQAETPTAVPTGDTTVLTLVELNRKPSSCPFLFTWNGSRFEFVTDFLGGGEMGSWEGPDERNTPHPVEYVRISDRQLRPQDGRLELRVTNELEEALFLDHLELLVATHPADVEVFPDEGLRDAFRPFHLYATRAARPPLSAHDEHGHDMMARLSRLDRHYLDDFQLLPFRGYAAPHTLTLDLGTAQSKRPGRSLLLLTGWTDYAFSSDNVAASQSRMKLQTPVLQVKSDNGGWLTVDADVGFPVGRPQTLVVDITRHLGRMVRLVTNMRIYWDLIAVADSAEGSARVDVVPMRSATLRWRGYSAEVRPDGQEPAGYDYERVSLESPWKVMPGRYTREGDVAELIAKADDRFVVSRPGDELVVSFDASALPPLGPSERRTFLLHSVGYSKEMNFHSASPDELAPLPFRAMTRYPYSRSERYPHPEDLDEFHTRLVPRSIHSIDVRR